MQFLKKTLNLSIIDKQTTTSRMKETFGTYIRKLRLERDLTLTQLAAKLNLDSANLSKIETGKREFDEKRLIKLANAFGLDIEMLKAEFFSDLIAKKLYQNNCNEETLVMAEEKVKYLRQVNSKQGKLKI